MLWLVHVTIRASLQHDNGTTPRVTQLGCLATGYRSPSTSARGVDSSCWKAADEANLWVLTVLEFWFHARGVVQIFVWWPWYGEWVREKRSAAASRILGCIGRDNSNAPSGIHRCATALEAGTTPSASAADVAFESIRDDAQFVSDAVREDIILCARRLLTTAKLCQDTCGDEEGCPHSGWRACSYACGVIQGSSIRGSLRQEGIRERFTASDEPSPPAELKAFASSAFKQVRLELDIDMETYSRALDHKNFRDFNLSEGASAALTIPSQCGSYIVKTIHASEARVIQGTAQAYLRHLQANRDSYLRPAAYLGLYAVKIYRSTGFFDMCLDIFVLACVWTCRRDAQACVSTYVSACVLRCA